MIKVDARATIRSLQEAKRIIQRKLEGMVVKFSYNFVLESALKNNPVGEESNLFNFYLKRESILGFEPRGGLSKGNWQVDVGSISSITFDEFAFDKEGEKASADGRQVLNTEYKLGMPVYIGNATPYMLSADQMGQSIQARYGIRQVTLQDILKVTALDLKAYYDAS